MRLQSNRSPLCRFPMLNICANGERRILKNGERSQGKPETNGNATIVTPTVKRKGIIATPCGAKFLTSLEGRNAFIADMIRTGAHCRSIISMAAASRICARAQQKPTNGRFATGFASINQKPGKNIKFFAATAIGSSAMKTANIQEARS